MQETVKTGTAMTEEVIGSGLLAGSFDAKRVRELNARIFASGVSNSSETRHEAFLREERLLKRHLAAATGRFVYFSTCSISDLDRTASGYVMHKLRMESLVREHAPHFILRLPQVVGHTHNPHTLTNFLASNIASGVPFPVWTNALRCLVDVEHVAAITMELLKEETLSQTLEIAPPETISMRDLVPAMEQALGRKAVCTFIERGGGTVPDSSVMQAYAARIGIDISPGYSRRVIRKYYADRHP